MQRQYVRFLLLGVVLLIPVAQGGYSLEPQPAPLPPNIVAGVAGQLGLIVEDWNGDGILDLMTGQEFTGHVYVLFGKKRGSVSFSSPQPLKTQDGQIINVALGGFPGVVDWNGDGLKDLVVASPRTGFFLLFLNVGTSSNPVLSSGKWLTIRGSLLRSPEAPFGIRFADWNGDGKTDLLVGSEDRILVYINEGQGKEILLSPPQFICHTYGSICRFPLGFLNLDVADWNQDGKPDLIVGVEYRLNQRDLCEGMRSFIYVYLNVGTKINPLLDGGTRLTLADGTPLDAGGCCVPAPDAVDWNLDGKLDLIVANNSPFDPNLILFYENVGTAQSPVLEGPNFYYNGPRRVGEECD